MFLCHVVPFAVIQLGALCRRKWYNSVSVSVRYSHKWLVSLHGTSHRFWVTVVRNSHDSSLNVCNDHLWKSWQVFSPIHPPFLFFNPLFTFVLKPFKLFSPYIHPFFHFRFLLSHTLFLWRLFQVTFFLILHLVFTFIPYSSLSSLPSPSPSPPPVCFLMLYEVAVIGMHEEHEDVSVQNVWWTCVPLLSFPSHGLCCAGLEERLLTLSPWHNAH